MGNKSIMGKSNFWRGLLVALLLACAGTQAMAETIVVDTPQQDWQKRRAALFAVLSGDDQAKAARALQAALVGLEQNPVSLTPMEVMDLYGIYYVPQDGGSKMSDILMVVAIQATLGWYDSLRFADVSGQAEIANNEGFFKRAFVLGGEQGVKQLTELMSKHPKVAAKAVAGGIAIARKLRGHVDYDEHWPSAYGLAVMQCGLDKAKTCPPSPGLPQTAWDAAFDEAAAKVTKYYRINN